MASVEERSGAGRYAPSPSGDLHLGNLRTALLAWFFARSTNRGFYLRIEDLDRARDSGSAMSQIEDLYRLGLDWDGDPMWQTSRVAHYEATLGALTAQGLTYECTCSRKDILSAPSAPHAPVGSYPGICRDLTLVERETARARIAPRKPAIRLRVPHPHATVSFSDLVCGESGGEIDDMVLLRGDGTFAYNFVVVIDDAAMGIDQVVRGDDLLLSTPRQVALQRVLGFPEPEYAHVPLVLGPDLKRLAKRDGAVTLEDLESAGISLSEVLTKLGASLGLCKAQERVNLQALLSRFDPAHLTRTPWQFIPPHQTAN